MALLAALEGGPYPTCPIPGLGWASVAGLLAHVRGHHEKYHHGRQLIKLAGAMSLAPR